MTRKRGVTLEVLGEVRLTSPTVLVADLGLLNLWCHDRPPVMPPGMLSEALTDSINRGQDLRIDGRDATRAGALFDRQPTPRHLFDIPASGVAEVEKAFGEVVAVHHLDARLVALVPRVPHTRRATLACELGGGAGAFLAFGVPMVAASGLPVEVPLRVVGARRAEAPHAGRWDFVALEVQPGRAVTSSVHAGEVGVDWARLLFADVQGLGHWDHDRPTDGRGDFVFWGRDARTVARRFGADRTGDEEYGFLGLPVAEAAERGLAVEEAVKQGQLRLATDFRPHTQQYWLLKQMRASATESGTLDLGGSRTCAFFTSWGDGFFPVYRDLDASGALVRLRVHLGTEQAIGNLDAVNAR